MKTEKKKLHPDECLDKNGKIHKITYWDKSIEELIKEDLTKEELIEALSEAKNEIQLLRKAVARFDLQYF